jgi:hypothetical protein
MPQSAVLFAGYPACEGHPVQGGLTSEGSKRLAWGDPFSSELPQTRHEIAFEATQLRATNLWKFKGISIIFPFKSPSENSEI